MKIGQPSDPSPGVAQPAQVAPSKTGQGSAAAVSNRQSPGVGVTVSELARALEQANGAATPEVDMEKVNAVRQSIAEGTFVVNAEAIADKLLANAREMLDRTRS